MRQSPRFVTFVETYRDKIRKKIRGLRDIESRGDLQGELEVAFLLLQERQFAVAYEVYASVKRRGPDFTVTYKAHHTFNVEVTRMRAFRPQAYSDGLQAPGKRRWMPDSAPLERSAAGKRLADIICSKLGQLQPGMANVLVVLAERAALDSLDIEQSMRQLKQRAERWEPALPGRCRLHSTADFFKSWRRLSGLLLRYRQDNGSSMFESLWLNSQTRHPIPTDIRTKLQKP